MAIEVRDLSGYFVATVKGYDTMTRELDVFIPKLMPAIPDGKRTETLRTNYNNKKININYNENVKIGSSIKIKAEDATTPLPDIDSKVLVYFIDNSYQLGFWKIFNPNGDNTVIESEKYEKYFNIKIGDKEVQVDRDDKIEVEFEDEKVVILSKNEKTKTFKILKSYELENRISKLEVDLGTKRQNVFYSDNYGRPQVREEEPTGIYYKIEDLQNQITTLKEELDKLKGTGT